MDEQPSRTLSIGSNATNRARLSRALTGSTSKCTTEESVEPPADVPQPALEPADSAWIERAMRITQVCIDQLVLEFLDLPYLHRVEHSIHTRLYSILRNQPHFDRHFPLAVGGMLTQSIHKEWPETIPRPEKANRSGNFDLAILSPGQLRTCTLDSFSNGRPAPAVVIEMGLNYKEGHLTLDAEKLLNSRVLHGYLVHLVRDKPHESTIDQTIDRLPSEGTIKVAFARVERGRKFLKLLDDPGIHRIVARYRNGERRRPTNERQTRLIPHPSQWSHLATGRHYSPSLQHRLHFPRKPIGEQAPADEISPPHLRGQKLPRAWVRPVGDVEITLPNSQADQSFRSVAGKRSNGRAVYLGDPRLALLGRSPVGVEKSALTTPCPVAAGSVFSGKCSNTNNTREKGGCNMSYVARIADMRALLDSWADLLRHTEGSQVFSANERSLRDFRGLASHQVVLLLR